MPLLLAQSAICLQFRGQFIDPNRLHGCKVDDSTGICIFEDESVPNTKAIAFTVSGNTVAPPGAAVIVDPSGRGIDYWASPLNDGTNVIVQFENGTGVQVAILAVSGNLITPGPLNQILGSGAYHDLRVLGLSATRAVHQRVNQTAGDDIGIAVMLSIAGTTVTLAGPPANFGVTGGGDIIPFQMTRGNATVGFMVFASIGGTEWASELQVNGAIGVTTPQLTLPNTRRGLFGIVSIGAERAVILYDQDQIAVITTDLIGPPVAAQTGQFTLSVSPSREGQHVWSTHWLDDEMQLRRMNSTEALFDRILPLGAATFTDITTFVRVGRAFAVSDGRVFIYGNMNAPGSPGRDATHHRIR